MAGKKNRSKNRNKKVEENTQVKAVENSVETVEENIEEVTEEITEEITDEIKEAARESKKEKIQAKREKLQNKKEAFLKKREEAAAKRKERIQKLRGMTREERLEDYRLRRAELEHKVQEYSEKMKALLEQELEDYRKQNRAAEMMGIFASHNFYADGLSPKELRLTLEELGPTYVKIGQIMSGRTDILPEKYCKELEKLRQNVAPLDPDIAIAVIEQETGMAIDEIYSEFKKKPLGSASIGQAHYGVLLDGTKVVTKVQRPLIADMMRKDYELLKKLAGLVNVVSDSEDSDSIDLLAVVEEMEKVSYEELDFRIEAENTRFFHENCIGDGEAISCPEVIDELTTERIFTMTFVDGVSVTKRDKLIEDGYDVEAIGRTIVDNYLHQIFDVGTFHADPHQGNIIISEGKPYWIDFGMVGQIDDKDMNNIQSLVLSVINLDADGLVNTMLSMGTPNPKTNRDKLMQDAEQLLFKYMSVTSLNDLDMSVLFAEIMNVCSTHHVQMPGRFTMLVRSITAIEGVVEQLCPELNLFDLISNKMMDRMKKNIDLKQELINKGKELIEAGKRAAKIPNLLSQTLSDLVKGRMKFNMEVTGIDEPLHNLSVFVKYIVLAVFSCVLFIGSCILCLVDMQPKTPNGIPLVAEAGLVFSIALAIFSIRKMK
ncbi:MAG: hypothetical protein II799_02655 [Lachnospiraceae bacterium]|nr:hypothetical protein [Lachnospiraceae bacterium]